MPSMLHEGLMDLFRDDPSLAPRLLTSALGVPVPRHGAVEVVESNLSQVAPPELHADLVLRLLPVGREKGREEAAEGAPGLALVIEVQLARDGDKRFTWPAYLAVLRSRLRCQAAVVVVTPDARVARWAARLVILGPGMVFRPLVLGPRQIPKVTDPLRARASPELAVLSALAHAREPDAARVAFAAAIAAGVVDDERARIYYDLVMSALEPAARALLEEIMGRGRYEYQSDFARKYYGAGVAEGRTEGKAEGKAEGRAEALLAFLSARGIAVDDGARATIMGCTDVDRLDQWIRRAATAESLAEVLRDDA